MQNSQIAAAASADAAAAKIAALSGFEYLCKIINKYRYSSAEMSMQELETYDLLIGEALTIISRKAGFPDRYWTFSDICDLFGFYSQRRAGRLLRKAVAFQISGLGDFWDYLKFAARVTEYRACIEMDKVSRADFKAREFFTACIKGNGGPIRGVEMVVFQIFNTKNFRLALDSRGDLKPYHKNDTFFCPLLNSYASDSNLTRVFTIDSALYAIAAPHGNGQHRTNHLGPFYEVSVSDRALSISRAGYFINYYRAVIFENEFQHFEIMTIEETGDFAHISEGYIWADGLLHERPEGYVCSPDDAVSSYHGNTRLTTTPVRFSRNAPYLAGFEVEKEDEAVKCSITARDFYSALPNFRKERDGSLDSRTGFEFITPPLELSPRNIRAYLEERPVAVAHINAGFSTQCGGHIHLSRRGVSGPDLFRMIAGHLPLLHALFPARADGSNSRYCVAKSADALLRDREKYQSINILPDRIEFRIFGAVRGLDNLIWRAGLVLKLFKHGATTPAQGYEVLPRFYAHLRKVYKTPAEMEMLIKRVERYARKFESYRPNFGADIASGIITDAARFKTYRPASARAQSKKSVLS